MKAVFLTSSFNNYTKIGKQKVATKIDNTNHFVDRLKLFLPIINSVAFVSSNPDDFEKTDNYVQIFLESFALEGYNIKNAFILDHRIKENIKDVILKSDLIIAMGGHVPTQNRYMKEISLKEILKEYNGVYIGQSAGSMNACESVYVQPETKEEFYDKNFNKNLTGLGLTDIMIMPHTNNAKKYEIDGTTQYDMCLQDSYIFHHYGIVDSGFVEILDNSIRFYGETIYFSNGTNKTLCKNGQIYDLLESQLKNNFNLYKKP